MAAATPAVTETRYRRDIDGLRALAVIPVVLFHAGSSLFSGGFVGVDVFFVISGYLITTLILHDQDSSGGFGLGRFYERRVRRILPALFVVLLVAAILAYVTLTPKDLRSFGASLAATVFFSSNILFNLQAGYFDQEAITKPLLHTWSLAVEEQFYIGYPVFLWAVGRFAKKRYTAAIAAMLVLSFVWNVLRIGAHPSETFYLAPPRAWELMVGSLLAVGLVPDIRRAATANVLAILGVAGVLFAVFAYSDSTPFPGLSAVPPVLGTALLLHSGRSRSSVVARILSFRPLAFIGLISYSLYLWHWILIVYARYENVVPLSPLQTTGVIALSVVLAAASWRFVENPFRGRRGIGTRSQLFLGSAVAFVALAVAGTYAAARNGLPSRFTATERALITEGDWSRRNECRNKVCRIGDSTTAPAVLWWGDSHGYRLAPAMDAAARSRGLSGWAVSQGACAPLLGFQRYDALRQNCRPLQDSVLALIARDHIRLVVLHARWANNVEGVAFGDEARSTIFLTPGKRPSENAAVVERLLRTTIRELQSRGANVAIVASIPEVGTNVPHLLAKESRYGTSLGLVPSLAAFRSRQRRSFELLERIGAEFGVRIVYPHEVLCDERQCALVRDGQGLYSDATHLSLRGAQFLVPLLDRLLAGYEDGGVLSRVP